MSFSRKLLGCLFFLACCAAWAGKDDVYTYVDQDGVVHFTNVPDQGRVYRKLSGVKKSPPMLTRVKKNKAAPAKTFPPEYEPYVIEAERMFGVPAELIRAVMAVESS
jgi:membrane-bound lytic murein transglycosylase B